MFDFLAISIKRFRWPLLVGLVAATVLAGTVAKDIRFDFSPRSLFLTTDDEVLFLEAHRAQFGDEDALFMLLVEASDVFQAEVLRAVSDLSDRVELLPHIEAVFSLSTVQEIEAGPLGIQVKRLLEELPEDDSASKALRERTVKNPLFLRRFVNPEGTATAILCKFDNGFVEELDRRPVLSQVEELVAEFRTDELDVTLVGLPVVNREYAVLLQSDMARTIAASVVLLALLLFVLFRNPYSVLLPIVAVIVAVAWTVAYMVITDDYFNIINCVIPTLLLVIGVGDAVHFLTAYYQELGSGTGKDKALHAMVVRVGGACLLTSVTASVGFASLIVARIDIIKTMGQVAAVGLMVSYVAVLFLLPAVLSLVATPTAGVRSDPSEGRIGALLVWLGRVTIQRKKIITGATLLLCLVSALGAMRVKTDNFLLEELLPGNAVSQALHHTEEVLTGVMPSEISIRTDADGGVLEPEVLRGMERLQQHLADDAFVGHSFSLADLVKELAGAMDGERRIPDSREKVAQYLLAFEMSEDPSFLDSVVDGSRRIARISASQRDWGTENFFAWYDGSGQCDRRSARCASPPAPPFLDAIDEAFGTVDGRKEGLEVRVTGGNLVAARALSRVVDDMMWSLATAFVVISLQEEGEGAVVHRPLGPVSLSDREAATYVKQLTELFSDRKWVRARMKSMPRSAHVALVALLHSKGIGGGTWLLQELTQSHGMSEDLWAEVLHSLGAELWVFGNSRQSPPLFYIIPDCLAEELRHQFGRRLKLQPSQHEEKIRLSPDTNYRHPLGFSVISFLTYVRQNRIRVTRKGEIFKKNLDELSSFFTSLWGAGEEEKLLEWHLDVVKELGLCCQREGFLVADEHAIASFLAAGPDARRTLYMTYFLRREPLLGWLLEELHELEPDQWVPLQRIRTLYRRRYMGGVFHRRYIRQSYYLPPSGFYDPNPPLEVVQLAGLVESGLGSEGSYIRLSELGRRFVSGEGFEDLESCEGIRFLVQPNFEVLAPVGLDLPVLWQLGSVASLQRVDRASTYVLSRQSVRDGLAAGLRSEEAVNFLRDESSAELPQNVASTLTDWVGSHGEVELHDALVLSTQSARAATVRKILVAEGIQFESLDNTVFAIPRELREKVLGALQKKGLSPAPSVRRHDLADNPNTNTGAQSRFDDRNEDIELKRITFPAKALVMLGAPAAEGGKEAMARRGFRAGKVGANAVGADLSVKPAAAGAGALLKLSPAKTISVVKAAIRLKLDLEVLYPSTKEDDPGGLSRVTPIDVQEAGGSSFFSGHHHGLDREVQFRIKRIHGIRLAT